MMDKKIFELMLIPIGIIFCGFVLILLHNHPMFSNVTVYDFSYIPWLMIEIFLAFFIEFLITKTKRKRNLWLFPCAFFLANLGLIIIGRLEENLIIPQIRWIIIGMIVFLITSRFELFIKKILYYKYILGISFLVFMLIPFFINDKINGITNWLTLSAEFSRIFLIFFIASIKKDIKFYLILYLLSIFLFVYAKDFYNAFALFFITTIFLYATTGIKHYFLIPFITLFSSMIFFDILETENFFKNFESIFGVWGMGFTTAKIHEFDAFLVIAEEFGLIGVILIMFVYLLFFYQCVSIACNLKNETEILLIFGIGILFFTQIFLNPFMRYGACYIIPNFVLLGILISFSREDSNES